MKSDLACFGRRWLVGVVMAGCVSPFLSSLSQAQEQPQVVMGAAVVRSLKTLDTFRNQVNRLDENLGFYQYRNCGRVLSQGSKLRSLAQGVNSGVVCGVDGAGNKVKTPSAQQVWLQYMKRVPFQSCRNLKTQPKAMSDLAAEDFEQVACLIAQDQITSGIRKMAQLELSADDLQDLGYRKTKCDSWGDS